MTNMRRLTAVPTRSTEQRVPAAPGGNITQRIGAPVGGTITPSLGESVTTSPPPGGSTDTFYLTLEDVSGVLALETSGNLVLESA